ncbi:MAG: hypothetical protein KDC46_11085 [Thermoleophilia bacterium]|nr:hypothetical protein [Thermoleophilia bacterium]
MHTGRAHAGRETATTTLELVGITVGAALLLGGVATGLSPRGDSIGGAVVGRVRELVAGEQTTRRWRDQREVRTGGGNAPQRVPRDELRMTPFMDPIAWWSGSRQTKGEVAGIRMHADVQVCVVCGSGEWSYELVRGGQAGTGAKRAAGLGGSIEATMRAAIVSAQVAMGVERDIGGVGSVFVNGRARGTIGAEARGALQARVTRESVDAEVDGGAMAGAVARAETRTGVDVLGISIRQSAKAEGWAGAGVRGSFGLHTSNGRVEWRMGWGAALGLGGATEWSGSMDVSKVSATHRRLARDSLAAALGPLGAPLRVLGRDD